MFMVVGFCFFDYDYDYGRGGPHPSITIRKVEGVQASAAGHIKKLHPKRKAMWLCSSKFKVPSSKLSQAVINDRDGNLGIIFSKSTLKNLQLSRT